MTDRLSVVQHRIATVGQLGAVVNAMRGIAAARAQQSRALLPAVRAYADTAQRAIRLAEALPGLAARSPGFSVGRNVWILFGAEQGFAGAFPEQMLDAIGHDPDPCDLFLIGQRTLMLAEQRAIAAVWKAAIPNRAEALAGLATEIVEALYAHLGQVGPAPVGLVYATWAHAGGVRIVRRGLLPLEAVGKDGRSLVAPLANLPPGVLLDRFAQEYVFAAICEAACEAYAAENEVRAATMATAKTHIDEKLTALKAQERLTRQEQTTAEVIELASGARHVRGTARDGVSDRG